MRVACANLHNVNVHVHVLVSKAIRSGKLNVAHVTPTIILAAN